MNEDTKRSGAAPETSGRPDSAAGVLDAAAHWLDIGDNAIATLLTLGPAVGTLSAEDHARAEEAVEGKSVQRDLRLIANWLREHPDVDHQLRDLLAPHPAR